MNREPTMDTIWMEIRWFIYLFIFDLCAIAHDG